MPREMRSYLRQNGYSFSKKACAEAVKMLRRMNPATGKAEPIEPYTKEQAEEMLAAAGVKIENNVGYDFVYVLNYGRATLFKSSIPDEKALALYVKNEIDSPTVPGGNAFRRWCVDCDAMGVPIEWEDIL